MAGAKRFVTTDGVWTMARQAMLRTDLDPTCTRCNLAPETLKHRVWECRHNEGHPEFHDSQHLVELATQEWDQADIFWGRGLIPRELYPAFRSAASPRPALLKAGDYHVTWGMAGCTSSAKLAEDHMLPSQGSGELESVSPSCLGWTCGSWPRTPSTSWTKRTKKLGGTRLRQPWKPEGGPLPT